MAEAIIKMISGTAVFLFGIKTMSGALAGFGGGNGFAPARLLKKSRLAATAAGAGITAAVHSSSAVTALAIGLADTGALPLYTTAYVIMGSNIGTTLTGLIIALKSVDLSAYFLLFAVAGLILSFMKGKAGRLSGIFMGLGLLFAGLELVSPSAAIIAGTEFFRALFGGGNILLLMLMGILVTALVQSSTAVNGLTIMLAGTGALPLAGAAAIMLGSNIGTCLTVVLSAGMLGKSAKQAAVFHIFFNVFGSVLFFAVMAIAGNEACNRVLSRLGSTDELAIAVFNLIQNTVTTVILFPFGKKLMDFCGLFSSKKSKKTKSGATEN